MAINVSGSLQTTAVNLPLDARSRIATLDDVATIVNPVLGGIFYCVATGRHYRITKLKAQTSGPFTVADKQVDTYEQLPSKSDVEAKADTEHTHAQYALKTEVDSAIPPQRIVFDISGLTSSALVSLVIEFDSDASFPDGSTTLETYDSKTDADGRFIAWGGFELSRYPAAGIGAAYNGGCVIFIVPDSARAKGFYRYAWRSEAGESQGNLSSKHFGCLRAVTHQALFEDIF